MNCSRPNNSHPHLSAALIFSRFRALPLLLILALCATFILACGSSASGDGATSDDAFPERPTLVFAAASLTDAFREMDAAFSRAHPGASVEFVFDGSQRLRVQLEHGARADVFASADWRQVQAAERAGVLAGEPRSFASNRLVFLLHRESGFFSLDGEGAYSQTPQANVNSLINGLASPGARVVVAHSESPVGQYTEDLLENMGSDPDFGQRFTLGFSANIVSRETNVRGVVQKVALGEADAGVAYRTDALTPQVWAKVLPLEVSEDLRVTANYPIAPLSRTVQAERFIDFVISAEGQSILSKHGFGPPQP